VGLHSAAGLQHLLCLCSFISTKCTDCTCPLHIRTLCAQKPPPLPPTCACLAACLLGSCLGCHNSCCISALTECCCPVVPSSSSSLPPSLPGPCSQQWNLVEFLPRALHQQMQLLLAEWMYLPWQEANRQAARARGASQGGSQAALDTRQAEQMQVGGWWVFAGRTQFLLLRQEWGDWRFFDSNTLIDAGPGFVLLLQYATVLMRVTALDQPS